MYTPITDLITKEIKWHEAHRGISGKSEDFEAGFIKGLEQARTVVEHVERVWESVPAHSEEFD
jgi:hypothetical protein